MQYEEAAREPWQGWERALGTALLPMVEGVVQESEFSQAPGLQCLPQCCCSAPGSSLSPPWLAWSQAKPCCRHGHE